jgi:hypothetical protein
VPGVSDPADLDLEDGSFHGKADDVFHHGFDRGQVAGWLTSDGLAHVSVKDAHWLNKASASETRDYSILLAAGHKA